MTYILSTEDLVEMKKLAALVRDLNTKGHNPATSGNYSLRSKTRADVALVSESGVEKSQFSEDHFLPLTILTGKIDESDKYAHRKSSDETDIHLSLYQSTEAQCVLHSHMLDSLLYANLFLDRDTAVVKDLELLKGFRNIKSHDVEITIPLFDNTQDIKDLSLRIKPILSREKNIFGLILRGHGIYVWGQSVEEAKRHLEVFEYIFKYVLRSKNL